MSRFVTLLRGRGIAVTALHVLIGNKDIASGHASRAWPSLRPHRAGLSSLEAEVFLRPLAESGDAGLRSRDNLARNGERTDEGR